MDSILLNGGEKKKKRFVSLTQTYPFYAWNRIWFWPEREAFVKVAVAERVPAGAWHLIQLATRTPGKPRSPDEHVFVTTREKQKRLVWEESCSFSLWWKQRTASPGSPAVSVTLTRGFGANTELLPREWVSAFRKKQSPPDSLWLGRN